MHEPASNVEQMISETPHQAWVMDQVVGGTVLYVSAGDFDFARALTDRGFEVTTISLAEMASALSGDSTASVDMIILDPASATPSQLADCLNACRSVLGAGGTLVTWYALTGDTTAGKVGLTAATLVGMLGNTFSAVAVQLTGEDCRCKAAQSDLVVQPTSAESLVEQFETLAAMSSESAAQPGSQQLTSPTTAHLDSHSSAIRELQRQVHQLAVRFLDGGPAAPEQFQPASISAPPDNPINDGMNSKMTWLRAKITRLEGERARDKHRGKVYRNITRGLVGSSRVGKLDPPTVGQRLRQLRGFPPLRQADVEEKLKMQLALGGTDAAKQWVATAHSKRHATEAILWRVAFDEVASWEPAEAKQFARRAIDLNPYDEGLRTRAQAALDGSFDNLTTDANYLPGRLEGRLPIPAKANRPTVAVVLDEFSTSCLAPEWNLVTLSRDDWERELRSARPAMLFMESTWRGNAGQWSYAMTKPDGERGQQLARVVKWCRDEEIPTVFWNKEDPANFDVFIKTASYFDYVFTTDAECVDAYKEKLGHERVFAMPFAAQPHLHNPIGAPRERLAKACFAGSYRGDKYPGRREELETLVAPLLGKQQVDIYDRFAGTADEAKYGFPDPYRSAVVGSLPYEELVERYRDYTMFLNVNSVQDSPTMFSRRVFEIMACRTPVLSTYQRGIESMLGGACLLTRSAEDTLQTADKLFTEEEQWARTAHTGYRTVMRDHTYAKRVDEMARLVGLSISPNRSRKITVICVSKRPDNFPMVLENYDRQTYQARELVYVFNGNEADLPARAKEAAERSDVSVQVCRPEMSLGECLNAGRAASDSDLWTKMDDDDHYGSNYLLDATLPFDYSAAAVVGKRSYYCYFQELDQLGLRFAGREFCYTDLVHGGTLVADRARTDSINFEVAKQGTDTLFVKACIDAELPIFSADRFNFVHMRYSGSGHHTWQIKDAEMLEKCEAVRPTLDLGRVDV